MAGIPADDLKTLERAWAVLSAEQGSGEYSNSVRDMILGAATRLEDVIDELKSKEEA